MSNELNIRKLFFLKNEYTNCFFISCNKYTWKFTLNNRAHIIYLFFIKIFGKRQIYVDSKKIYDKSKYMNDFHISFPIEFYNVTIIQKENNFILKINDISFNKILNDIKLKKFNILEDNYRLIQEEKKKKKMQKRKNKILLNLVKSLGKYEKNTYEINLNNEKEELDDSKTIQQSLEINEKDLDTINKIYKDNINSKYNDNNKNNERSDKKDTDKKFKPKEKKSDKFSEKKDNSNNYIIDHDSLEYDSFFSNDIRSTNIYKNSNSNDSSSKDIKYPSNSQNK